MWRITRPSLAEAAARQAAMSKAPTGPSPPMVPPLRRGDGNDAGRCGALGLLALAVLVLGLGAVLAAAGVRWSRAPAEVRRPCGALRGDLRAAVCTPDARRTVRSRRVRNNLSRLDVILAADPERPPPPDGRLILHLRPDTPGVDVRALAMTFGRSRFRCASWGLPASPGAGPAPRGSRPSSGPRYGLPLSPDSRLQRYVWLLEYYAWPGERAAPTADALPQRLPRRRALPER